MTWPSVESTRRASVDHHRPARPSPSQTDTTITRISHSLTRHKDKDICSKFYRKKSRPCTDDHVTKSRNRKLIRVTSSNERLTHKCVDLSNQCIYFNPIWYRTQIPDCQHTRIGAVSGNGIIKINLLLNAFPVVTAKERNVISIAFRHRSVHDGHNCRGTTGQWS